MSQHTLDDFLKRKRSSSSERESEEAHQDKKQETTVFGARAPLDDPGLSPDDADGVEGKCFACMYCASAKQSRTGDCDDGVYSELTRLLQAYHTSHLPIREAVERVHDYYEAEVSKHADHGAWSRRSIKNHILIHSSTASQQVAENKNMVQNMIRSLRNTCWSFDTGTGVYEPNISYISAIDKLTVLHRYLVSAHPSVDGPPKRVK